MIPGTNLLETALRVIASEGAELLPADGRTKNSRGMFVTNYGTPVPISGSVQPVPRSLYQNLGLDFEKNYIMIYTSARIRDVGRDGSPDRIRFDSKLFTALGSNDWTAIDGWNGVMLIQVSSQ